MKLNIFGREVEIVRNQHRWIAYYLGNEGKKRIAHDIVIPANIAESELVEYVSDLCHEWATTKNNEVRVL